MKLYKVMYGNAFSDDREVASFEFREEAIKYINTKEQEPGFVEIYEEYYIKEVEE